MGLNGNVAMTDGPRQNEECGARVKLNDQPKIEEDEMASLYWVIHRICT